MFDLTGYMNGQAASSSGGSTPAMRAIGASTANGSSRKASLATSSSAALSSRSSESFLGLQA
jgi:hypothetical protein